MTGAVVNLKAVRKARARTEAKGVADANAAKFGLSKAERERLAAEADKARRDLDGHQRE